MRLDLEQYYLIDQYLENKIKGEELVAFEKQLLEDNSFANEVIEQRMLNDCILEAELKSVRSQMQKDLLTIQQPSFFRMNWQWIGLGFLLLSGVLYSTINNEETPSKQKETTSSEVITNITQTKKSIAKTNSTIQTSELKKQNSTSSLNTNFTSNNTNILVRDTIQSLKVIEENPAKNILPQQTIEPQNSIKLVEENKKIDCALNKIVVTFTTRSSCKNEQDGSIRIDKITGGASPYTYTLNNKRIKENFISHLESGNYLIKISDKNGCFTEQIATVQEDICAPTIQHATNFNINPTIGEVCHISFNSNKKGNLTIYNRGGKVMYQVLNPSSEFIEWNGTDGYGSLAAAGLYVYIIDYTDGTKETGEVNIIR